MKRAFPILGVLTAILLSYAIYQGLIAAPTDQLQGDVYRIIYYHVPSAWTAFLLFLINFVSSIQYLVRANARADRLANWIVVAIGVAVFLGAFLIPLPKGLYPSSVATTGAAIVALYGPLWARPVWGIWWAPGDIRLTSTLVLWLIYVSYLMLRRFSSSSQTSMLAAVLAIFGALDVPLVYFSIWFFRTQHPQPVIGGGGSIDPRMLHVLLINWAAFLCLAALVCWSRYRLEILQREVEETQALEALLEPRSPR